MLFDANVTMAIKCPHCGQSSIKDISYFDLAGSGEYVEVCQCGKIMFRIKSSDMKTFRVYVPCIACDKEHMYLFGSRYILSEKVKILSCPVSRIDIGFVGNRHLVREIANKNQKDLQELIDVLEI